MTLGELVARLQSLPEYQEGKTHIPVTAVLIRYRNSLDVTGLAVIDPYDLQGNAHPEVVLHIGGRHDSA